MMFPVFLELYHSFTSQLTHSALIEVPILDLIKKRNAKLKLKQCKGIR